MNNWFSLLMILVFIQYGDVEARHIGLDFKQYLSKKGIDSFLAGRESPDIPGGYENSWTLIEGKILVSNVMLSIVTNGFGTSEGVQRELSFRDDNNRLLPIIPCVKFCVPFPENLEKYGFWSLKFDPYNYHRYFDDWLIECFKRVNLSIAQKPSEAGKILDVTRILSQYGVKSVE